MERIKNKAEELVNNMYNCDKSTPNEAMAMLYNHAIQCALICVDEIIQTCALDEDYKGWDRLNSSHRKYWDEVYKEIEKLNI
jgi:predicted O-methyltransferase YrrM